MKSVAIWIIGVICKIITNFFSIDVHLYFCTAINSHFAKVNFKFSWKSLIVSKCGIENYRLFLLLTPSPTGFFQVLSGNVFKF